MAGDGSALGVGTGGQRSGGQGNGSALCVGLVDRGPVARGTGLPGCVCADTGPDSGSGAARSISADEEDRVSAAPVLFAGRLH